MPCSRGTSSLDVQLWGGGPFSAVSEDPGEKKSEWEPYVSPKISMTMEKQQFEDVSPTVLKKWSFQKFSFMYPETEPIEKCTWPPSARLFYLGRIRCSSTAKTDPRENIFVDLTFQKAILWNIPIGSMRLVYLPTFGLDFWYKCR